MTIKTTQYYVTLAMTGNHYRSVFFNDFSTVNSVVND